MRDPKLLNPGPVRATWLPKSKESQPVPQEDQRSFWQRLLSSLRPSFNVETDKKSGKKIGVFEIKGHADFCIIAACLMLTGCQTSNRISESQARADYDHIVRSVYDGP